MKLQKIPIVTALLLLSLALPVFAHGRGGRGGGGRGGGARMSGGAFAGPRGGAFVGPRGGAFVGPRGGAFVGPRGNFAVVGSRGAFIGRSGAFTGNRFNRFNRFDRFNRRNVNNVFVYGGGYPYYYPAVNYPDRATYQYPQSYYYGRSTSPVANAVAPVGEFAPVQMSGDVVANVQQALRNRGFYSGPIDGLSGGATRAAIRSYAAAIGLPSTGAIDGNLLASLGLM